MTPIIRLAKWRGKYASVTLDGFLLLKLSFISFTCEFMSSVFSWVVPGKGHLLNPHLQSPFHPQKWLCLRDGGKVSFLSITYYTFFFPFFYFNQSCSLRCLCPTFLPHIIGSLVDYEGSAMSHAFIAKLHVLDLLNGKFQIHPLDVKIRNWIMVLFCISMPFLAFTCFIKSSSISFHFVYDPCKLWLFWELYQHCALFENSLMSRFSLRY